MDALERYLGVKLVGPPSVGTSIQAKKLIGEPHVALVTVVEDLGLSLEFPDPAEDQVFWDRVDWLKFLDLGWAMGLSYEVGSAAF